MKQIDFTCRPSDKAMPWPHVWKHTVGSGHATLFLRADWQPLTVLVTNNALSMHPIETGSAHVELEDAGILHLEFTMPPHAISVITVELSPEQQARKPRL